MNQCFFLSIETNGKEILEYHERDKDGARVERGRKVRCELENAGVARNVCLNILRCTWNPSFAVHFMGRKGVRYPLF